MSNVSINSYFAVATDTLGKVYTMGSNDYGQLGDGTTAENHMMVLNFVGASNLTFVNAGVSAGVLSLTVPSISRTFGNVTLSDSTVTATADLGNLTVSDATGGFNGYHVSVKGTPFTEVGGAGFVIPSGSLSLSMPSSVIVDSGSASLAPTVGSGTITSDDNTARSVLSAAVSKGAGQYQIVFPTNALSLAIAPGTAKTDGVNYPGVATPYTTTLTWTITVGP
jgi:hypothetical protein